ncbi:MAG: hypothetical protein JWM98_2241 [Thermoleophilia bacterium]|nr:hypothetical protein [Thermoleophilia bacterium]
MRATTTRLLFAATAFVAAALVFLVQPMVAKQLLPTFGGAPSVWNTAVVFFQVVLLGGYAFAHVTLRLLGPRRQVFAQLGLALVALAFVPFSVRTGTHPPSGVPDAAWVVALLALAVGVPYLAMTTASVVLQRWYSVLGQPDSEDPYFLYSASNAGSLLGLLAFPFVLEPTLTTSGQERVWAIGFAVYLVGALACAVTVRRREGAAGPAVDPVGSTTDAAVTVGPDDERIARGRAVRWVFIAAVPSALMLGVTTFITTDVANAPLLWVLPLALYLVSFMVTFGRRLRVGTGAAGLLVAVSVTLLLFTELHLVDVTELQRTVVHLVAMTTAAVLAHAWLFADRPSSRHLTSFYLLLSLGGAIGGTFTALVAPVVFERVYEYPTVLAFALVLRPAILPAARRAAWRPSVRAGATIAEVTLAGVLAAVLARSATSSSTTYDVFGPNLPVLLAVTAGFALLALGRWGFATAATTLLVLFTVAGGSESRTLHVERNFFGSLRVEQDATSRRLLHGTTLHGIQLRDRALAREPGTYYSKDGPLGDVLEHFQRAGDFRRVGAVGLGTGTVASYARAGQRFTFYEIDPAVIDVATDPRWFTWIRDARARADVRIVEGDARLRLQDEAAAHRPRFDLLILDAYSSDAVPVHLLTVEALRLYARRLAPGGVMAFHISSRHLDLQPVVAASVARAGLVGTVRFDQFRTASQIKASAVPSLWVVVGRTRRDLEPLRGVRDWERLPRDRDGAWTDDYSNLARAIRWLPGHHASRPVG